MSVKETRTQIKRDMTCTALHGKIRRPRKRSECPETPCPYVSCEWHLMLDVNEHGAITKSYEDITEMPYTCLFEFIDKQRYIVNTEHNTTKGGILVEVGRALGITRERVRQIQNEALQKLSENVMLKNINDESDDESYSTKPHMTTGGI